jgi:hypothetical protein
MNTLTANLLAIMVCSVLLTLLFRRFGTKSSGKGRHITAVFTIEELQSIGILSVFKVVTKEIVTARDHSLGNVGKKYLEWLITSKKMAMIFEFDIDFQYDLRHGAFSVRITPDGTCSLTMPPCEYRVHIRDVTFYDEQAGRLLPLLLPDVINKLLGSGFNEEDRNRLMEEAKDQAEKLAQNLACRLSSEVQTSARQTMEMLAKGFGATGVAIHFPEADNMLKNGPITGSPLPQLAASVGKNE